MTAAIYRGPTRGYTLTNDDVEWLARSLWKESGSTEGRIAAAWGMMHRFLLVRGKWFGSPQAGTKPWTFRQFIRAFSQPVNPDWLETGVKCSPGSQYYGTWRCSPERLANRKAAQTTPYPQIPSEPRRIAEGFAEGKIKDPFRHSGPVYDWAACSETGGRGISVGNNCFLRLDDLKPSAWERGAIIPGSVRLDQSAGSIMGYTVAGAVAVMLGYGAWSIWDGRRRKR